MNSPMRFHGTLPKCARGAGCGVARGGAAASCAEA